MFIATLYQYLIVFGCENEAETFLAETPEDAVRQFLSDGGKLNAINAIYHCVEVTFNLEGANND